MTNATGIDGKKADNILLILERLAFDIAIFGKLALFTRSVFGNLWHTVNHVNPGSMMGQGYLDGALSLGTI